MRFDGWQNTSAGARLIARADRTMKISKVSIKNFRNFRDFEVDLGNKIILIGENASGKTNFLEALRLVLDSSFRPQLGHSDFNNRPDLLPFRGTEIEIKVQFTDFINDKDKDFHASAVDCFVILDPPTTQITFLYRPRDVSDDELHLATGPDYYETIWYGGSDITNVKGARQFRQRVKFRLIPALRDIESDMRIWQRSPLRRLTETMNLSGNSDFQNVAGQVARATEALQKIDPVKDLQNKIQERLTDMIEGMYAFDPKIGLLPTSPDELQKAMTLLFDENYSLDRASLGLANVLYLTMIMLEIELRRQSGRDDDFAYTILGIEEPESHLHPHLQRLVFHDFLKIDMPIILSTHSPNIVSVSEPEWLLLLKQNVEGTRKASTAGLATLSNWEFLKQDISRYLDVNRGESVFSKGVILVEGDTEVFLVPEFAKEMKNAGIVNYTLDGAGVSVVNVSGADFTPYVYFFGPAGLDLPVAILTDGDKYTGLKMRARALINSGDFSEIDCQKLEDALDRSADDLRTLLLEMNNCPYEGLSRGIKIAELLGAEGIEEIWQDYEQQEWAAVKDKLAKLGIFVNDWTIEEELIDVNYFDEMLAAYEELGATETQTNNMRAELIDKAVSKVIKRIETSGKGKGRFAQRLANKITVDKVPDYIADAIKFIILRVPQPTKSEDPSLLEEETKSTEG